MDERLKHLMDWADDSNVCSALMAIENGEDPVTSLATAVAGLAKSLRYAEDYVVIHKLGGHPK